jgi:hypothetical protein
MTIMKKLAMMLFALTIFFCALPPAQASNLMNGIQLFPADHILNIPIDTFPVDAKSSVYINNNGGSSGNLFAAWGKQSGLGADVVDETIPKSKVTFRTSRFSDNVLYPIPPIPHIEGGTTVGACTGDCHVLMLNEDTKKLYEIFDLEPKLPNGLYAAGNGAVWDLTGYVLRPEGWCSADAAGLPMLPVMIRYDEIVAGEINHAIRVTVPHTQNTYIWPARAQAGVANTGYPPMGQRFRLKASYDISGFSPTNQIILKAMKKYGMILADNGWDQDSRKWWIYGVSDARWDSADLWELTSVKGTDFEAVDVSSVMIDPNSGKARGVLTPMLPSVKVGIYKDGFWYLDKNGNGRWDAGTDTSHNFGVPGWTSIPGDWDGDGKTTLGISKDGSWYLDYNGNGQWNSGTDKSYHFGSPGWTPVAGDWDGDQKSEIGVFQNGIWYLDTDGSGSWNGGDKAFQFGSRGWTPVAGDWNGDRKTEIGVTNGQIWYLDTDGSGSWNGGDKAFQFGSPGWTPVVGDWDGDQKSEIGVYKNGIWYLDTDGSGSWNGGDTAFQFGSPGWMPVVGKWS